MKIYHIAIPILIAILFAWYCTKDDKPTEPTPLICITCTERTTNEREVFCGTEEEIKEKYRHYANENEFENKNWICE